MTKEQFERVIGEFYAECATEKVFARIGPGDDDCYLIIRGGDEFYTDLAGGIFIRRGKRFFYLPYETIIAVEADR